MAQSTASNKKVFTTGAIARLFGININTVIKWFDEGKLEGFRLPISNDRRIPLGSLRKFMTTHQIPMDLLDDSTQARRMYTRIPISSQITFTAQNGHTYGPYEGHLSDLSQGGARILAGGIEAFSIPSQQFGMMITVKDGPLADSSFSGQVVHLQPMEDELAIGMKFADIDAPNQGRLLSYLNSQLS